MRFFAMVKMSLGYLWSIFLFLGPRHKLYRLCMQETIILRGKMEVATARNLKISRILAFVHIITGFLLLVLGIVDRVHGFFWSGEGCFGIWCGIWVCLSI